MFFFLAVFFSFLFANKIEALLYTTVLDMQAQQSCGQICSLILLKLYKVMDGILLFSYFYVMK